ncbi:FAD-dependent oxidoreductase, partial [Chlorobium limicola]|uniref:FAD-dependent oxidoreductase n=1 Tax=Chlorobium limicola TaxID=1092 RepID=UPI000AF984D3
SGIDFLHHAASGNAIYPGKRVLVIGGGNTAVDAARTARRLGAEQVTILYRRTRREMPANHAEIEEAISEGITLHPLAAPTSINTSEGSVTVTALVMRQGEPDESGRRKPVPVSGSEFTITCDTVISATGQQVDCPKEDHDGVAINRNGTLAVDPQTLQSSVASIFAGGDCVTGADIAIRAVEQGKRAAYFIDCFLLGKTLKEEVAAFNSSYGPRDLAPASFYERAITNRVPVPEIAPESRTGGFMEVVTGFSETDAVKEAARCLQCRCKAVDTCRLRNLAARYLPDYACNQQEHPEFSITATPYILLEREKCVDCGICVRTLEECRTEPTADYRKLAASCPTGALSEPAQSR